MRKLLALGASLCMLVGFAVPASASLVSNQTFPAAPVFEPLANPCNGEAITIDPASVVHLIMTVTNNSSGGVHIDINGNADGVKGTGSLGNHYQIPAWFHVNFDASTTGASTFIEGDIFNVVSLGSAPNFVHEDTLTIVANPTTGILSITASNMHDKCVA